jgi:hypothetical protein
LHLQYFSLYSQWNLSTFLWSAPRFPFGRFPGFIRLFWWERRVDEVIGILNLNLAWQSNPQAARTNLYWHRMLSSRQPVVFFESKVTIEWLILLTGWGRGGGLRFLKRQLGDQVNSYTFLWLSPVIPSKCRYSVSTFATTTSF